MRLAHFSRSAALLPCIMAMSASARPHSPNVKRSLSRQYLAPISKAQRGLCRVQQKPTHVSNSHSRRQVSSALTSSELDGTSADATPAISSTAQIVQSHLEGQTQSLPGGLYLVSTPIGNLEDITIRALRILQRASLVLAEDTRHTARLLQHFAIATPMMSYHAHNLAERERDVIQRLRGGAVLALVSDAGTPAISDPGRELVAACIREDLRVVPVPGCSAVLAALVASGLPTKSFDYRGFLPASSGARRDELAACTAVPSTLVFFVPPHKLAAVLEDAIAVLGPDRQCALARELTKLHEQFLRGSLSQVAAWVETAPESVKGEMTLVVAGCSGQQGAASSPREGDLTTSLRELISGGMSPSEAVRLVAPNSGLSKKRVYALALEVAKETNGKIGQLG
eukprot:jgi/Mesvir1/20805/Mv07907-RA.1